MKVNVIHTAVDWQSIVAAGSTNSSNSLVHVHKAGSSPTHHSHVTSVLPVLFIQPLYKAYIFEQSDKDIIVNKYNFLKHLHYLKYFYNFNNMQQA